MRTLIIMLAVLLAGSVVEGSTTITFEQWPDGNDINIPESPPTPITNEFQEWGVIFQNDTEICRHSVPSDAPSPNNVLPAGQNTTLDAYFVCPNDSNFLGTVGWVEITQDYGAQSGGGTLEAYDLHGNLVDSVTFNTSGGTFRVAYSGGIHRVYVGACKDGLDDFTFGDIKCIPLVISPNGGESWMAGTTELIQWESANDVNFPEVKIEWSLNGGTDWNDVNTVANSGSYEWLVPEVTSPNCLVRISDANDANIYDTSDAVFTMFQCQRTEVSYTEDFSADPNWVTNSASLMYWDANSERYHLKSWDTGAQYTYVNIPYSPDCSYRLEFDVNIVSVDWAGDVRFGFGDADMNSYDSTTWWINYWRGDHGHGVMFNYYSDTSSGQLCDPYAFYYDLNTEYHNVIVYNASVDTLSWKVIRVSDGVVMVDCSPIEVGMFTGIDRLYSSSIGDNYSSGKVGEGYIDNIVLWASCAGRLSGDLNDDCYVDFWDFAVVADHWLECGNPFDPDCGLE
jgi:hypothetical protein